MRTKGTLWLYSVVVAVFALVLVWWIVFFLRQGDLLVSRADRAGAALTPEQAEALRAAAHHSLRMFLYEGGFLLLAFGAGVYLVLRALRREIVLARQQSEFLSAVTHELRSPLASARLHVQSLRLGRVAAEKREHYLANAEADLARLSELVERVLESARVSSGPARLVLERLDLAEFTARPARSLVGAGEPALALELAAPGAVPVEADPSALETILRNLIANAAKYAADAGRLRIAVERDGRGPLVKSRPGVGLGLFLVAELVRAQGGRVRARNAEGGGFEVEVRLPLSAEGAGSASVAPRPDPILR